MAEQVYESQGHDFKLRIIIVNKEEWDKAINLSSTFDKQYGELFRRIVFECHKYLIRVTPIMTGRLRAGWTAYLNKYNQNYSSAFIDVTLVEAHNQPLDETAVSEGMSLSQFLETGYDVSIINLVHYGEYVEFGTSKMESRNFTLKALYKSEFIFQDSVDNWWNNATLDLEVRPDTVKEVNA